MVGDSMVKRIYIDEDYCVSCGLCQVYCRTEHSEYDDIIKAHKKEDSEPVSGIFKEEEEPSSFAVQCRHCEEAPCIDACITGAMHRDPETGSVVRDEDKCVGCWSCLMVCPLGVVKRDEDEKSVAMKCNLCPDKDTPVCVANCPNEVLELR